jgi:hypothetical protein
LAINNVWYEKRSLGRFFKRNKKKQTKINLPYSRL